MKTLEREFTNKFIVTGSIEPVLTDQFTVFLHKDDFKVKGLNEQDILRCTAFVISCRQSLASDPVLNAFIFVIMFCQFRVLFQIHFVSCFHFLYSYGGGGCRIIEQLLIQFEKAWCRNLPLSKMGPLLKKKLESVFIQIIQIKMYNFLFF